MTLEYVINTYGCLAIFLGTFIEGETVLITGGLAAQLGYLRLPFVILAAFAGSMCWDQLLFFIGRRHGRAVLDRFPRLQPRARQVMRMIERYRTPVLLVFPFVHGLRETSPIVIGMSRVRWIQFILLNSFAAVIWAVSLGFGGYLFGHALEIIIGDVKRYEMGGLIAIGSIAILILIITHWRSRFREAGNGEPPRPHAGS